IAYWDMKDPQMELLLQTLTIEADIKLAHFSTYLPEDSRVDIGGYAYADFYKVYKSTLIVALYERYWAIIRNTSSVVTYPEQALAAMYAANANITEETAMAILKDLSDAS